LKNVTGSLNIYANGFMWLHITESEHMVQQQFGATHGLQAYK
jgi:hypothetical protein